jgi:hypothetical protein
VATGQELGRFDPELLAAPVVTTVNLNTQRRPVQCGRVVVSSHALTWIERRSGPPPLLRRSSAGDADPGGVLTVALA